MGRDTAMAKSIKQANGLMNSEIFGVPFQVVILLVIILLLPLTIAIVKAEPIITGYNNSITNDSIYPHVNVNQNIKFNVSANESITTWKWYLDHVLLINNYNNYSKSWTEGGAHTVNVSGTNAGGTTGIITWYIMVLRPKSTASDIHVALNTSWFDNLKNSFGGDWDFSKFFVAITIPFTYWLGNLFYLFVFGLPMVVIWMRQEKALIPAVIGVIFGGLIFGFLPATWVLPATLMIILTIFGILYALFKER